MSNNEDLRQKVVETAEWAMGFVSDCDAGPDQIDSESVNKVLDSTSKILNQINEMDKIQLEAKEKEASRLQQLEIENKKLEMEKERLEQDKISTKQKEKTEKRRTWVEVAKVVATFAGAFLTWSAYNRLFKMHKNDDFMTGTERDALNEANRIGSTKY